MNKRQMIVLWLIVLVLSVIAFIEGQRPPDAFIRFGLPAVLIGGMLIYQFRDKGQHNAQNHTRNILTAVVAIMVLQTLLVGRGDAALIFQAG